MDRSRLEILPKVWIDYRRAIYFEEHGLLAVADLHLGYAWAHRYNGQMIPFGGGDQLTERLEDLCSFFKPKGIALLGDIVHQAVPVNEVAEALQSLLKALTKTCETKVVLGNHDKQLKSLLGTRHFALSTSLRVGKFLLVHGNAIHATETKSVSVMGHEHPTISLGDGILGAKFPCFLLSESVLILPAFSLWAAGTNIRHHPFMSPIAQQTRFERAIAICGNKLLPVPL